MRALFGITTMAFALLAIAGPFTSGAAGDVGVVAQSTRVAKPGEMVQVRVACGFCDDGAEFPVSMVPLAQYPAPYPCGNNALCRPGTRKPPRRFPYVFLGKTESVPAPAKWGSVRADSVIRFRTPEVEPGRYAFVVYCGPCMRGPKGSLITSGPNTKRGNLLVMAAARTSPSAVAGESGGDGVGAWAWVSGALVLAFGLGLAMWQRGSRGIKSR